MTKKSLKTMFGGMKQELNELKIDFDFELSELSNNKMVNLTTFKKSLVKQRSKLKLTLMILPLKV